ncbi:MAG: hypothetical protein HOV83_14170 [Catenulispora sp.]|nr:hypothetical protein [Catenulispora sp.]
MQYACICDSPPAGGWVPVADDEGAFGVWGAAEPLSPLAGGAVAVSSVAAVVGATPFSGGVCGWSPTICAPPLDSVEVGAEGAVCAVFWP